MDVRGVTDQVVPVALAYWMDQPARLTAVCPLLNISMKSFLKGAPEFPPPPKIWVTKSFVVGDGDGVGEAEGEGEGIGEGPGVGPLFMFCGSLGVSSWKSLKLSFVS